MNEFPSQISPKVFFISAASFTFFFDLESFIPGRWWHGLLTKDMMLDSQKHEKQQLWAHSDADEWRKTEKSVNVYHDLVISWKVSLPLASTRVQYVQWVRKRGSTHSALQKAIFQMSPGFSMAVIFFPQFNTKSVFDTIPEVDTDSLLESDLLKEPENVWKVRLQFETSLSILYLKYQDTWSPSTSRDRINGTEALFS